TTLFAAFNILNGKVMGSCLSRHRSREFLRFIKQLEQEVPPDLEIHLILDNYSTHKSQAVQRWLQPKKRQRFHLHFTPTSSSWLKASASGSTTTPTGNPRTPKYGKGAYARGRKAAMLASRSGHARES